MVRTPWCGAGTTGRWWCLKHDSCVVGCAAARLAWRRGTAPGAAELQQTATPRRVPTNVPRLRASTMCETRHSSCLTGTDICMVAFVKPLFNCPSRQSVRHRSQFLRRRAVRDAQYATPVKACASARGNRVLRFVLPLVAPRGLDSAWWPVPRRTAPYAAATNRCR